LMSIMRKISRTQQALITTSRPLQAPETPTHRAFLRGTASSLMLSRMYEVVELKKRVDKIGTVLLKLNDFRDAIENINQLHASLEMLIDEEMRSALAIIDTHNFELDGRVQPFAHSLAKVVSLFMLPDVE
jgi:hypothetical protein